MDGPELDAFAAECQSIEATLAVLDPQGWERTALGSWCLAELVAHLVRQVSRITAYADRPVPSGAAAVDRRTYYRYDVSAVAPEVAARAVADAAAVDPASLPAAFAEAWRADAALAAALPADRLLTSIRGAIRLDEYLATRVLEAVVHHLDLRVALDLPAAASPQGGRLVTALLESMLDGPRPRALGRVRFLQVATGRIPSDDPRFPLLG